MKVNILGTEYEVIKDSTGKNPKLEKAHGYYEGYSKKIVLEDKYEDDPQTIEKFDEFKKKVFRHEIVHAFFHEAGLRSYCEDEALVDWIALQIPKLIKSMKEVDCL